jgi:hypothetical protein
MKSWSWMGQRRPQLEALECRWNPSTVRMHGDTLVIVGTQGADTVEITDDGEGGLTVTYDNTARNGNGNGNGSGSRSNGSRGGNSSGSGSDSNGSNGGGNGGGGGLTTRTFDDVERVVFIGRGGDDNFSYELTGELTTDRELRLDLGAGDDTATLDFAAGVNDAELEVDVRGAGGDDTVDATFGDVTDGDVSLRARLGAGTDELTADLTGDVTGDSDVELDADGGNGDDVLGFNLAGAIDEDATVEVDADGGRGNDDISLTYAGVIDGELDIRLDGGIGNDVVAGTVTAEGAGTGEVTARVRGGRGDDDLTLNIVAPAGVDVSGLLDGGRGTDTCVATPNVTVINCEL